MNGLSGIYSISTNIRKKKKNNEYFKTCRVFRVFLPNFLSALIFFSLVACLNQRLIAVENIRFLGIKRLKFQTDMTNMIDLYAS